MAFLSLVKMSYSVWIPPHRNFALLKRAREYMAARNSLAFILRLSKCEQFFALPLSRVARFKFSTRQV